MTAEKLNEKIGCAFCGEEQNILLQCNHCGKKFCIGHGLVEAHNCDALPLEKSVEIRHTNAKRLSKVEVFGIAIMIIGLGIAAFLGVGGYFSNHSTVPIQISTPSQTSASQEISSPVQAFQSQPDAETKDLSSDQSVSTQEQVDPQIKTQSQESSDQIQTSEKLLNATKSLQNLILIGEWHSIIKNDNIVSVLSLTDKQHKNIAVDGIADIVIVNSKMEQVYSNSLKINKEDFTIRSQTDQTIHGVNLDIPLTEVTKGKSSKGMIYLKFRTNDIVLGQISASIVGLPTLTDNQINQLNELKYSQSAILLNEKVSKGNFEVMLTKAGQFNYFDSSNEQQVFRVDLEVKNIGFQPNSFNPVNILLEDNNGNQYAYLYGGLLTSNSQITPGADKIGYIMFDKIPNNLQSLKLNFQLGHDLNFEPFNFEYNILLK